MIIFPALDLKDGNCVRLVQGDFDRKQIFSEDPIAIGLKWQSQGAKYLHLVDLGGALTGIPENKAVIKKIIKTLNIPVQVGGGIRSMVYADELISAGAARIILGTSALSDSTFVKNVLEKYQERVAVSIDAKDGFAAVKGWTEVSAVKASDLANLLKTYGLQTIVYTDIAKDGMMSGPNFKELAEMQQKTEIDIIASGGVSTPSDVERIAEMGLYGVIIGRALYTGDINLMDFKQKGSI